MRPRVERRQVGHPDVAEEGDTAVLSPSSVASRSSASRIGPSPTNTQFDLGHRHGARGAEVGRLTRLEPPDEETEIIESDSGRAAWA